MLKLRRAFVHTQADTDAFSHLALWEQHEVGRMYIFDSTLNRLPSSGQIGVNDLAAASRTCSRERLICFDFILGSEYLMASVPSFRSARLWDPSDPQAAALERIVSKWTAWYKQHRTSRPSGAAGVLLQKMVHIRRPDSRGLTDSRPWPT